MQEATWREVFGRNWSDDDAPPQRNASDVVWRELLTLALTTIAFMSVVWSVESADWVRGLPSLYPIGFSAMIVAYGLSRVRLNQLLLIPAGIFAGTTIVFLQLMAILPGHSLYVRTDGLLDRMHLWWSSITQHGIDPDPMPVIVIMLAMTWLGSFLAAWTIFRWRNPVLGVIPGAAALMWDVAFSTSEFSIPSVIYLFAAVLLIMRMSVARRERQWERNGLPYPQFISLSVLHATFWMTCLLLAAALLIPVGGRSGNANDRWDALTAPIRHHLTPVARAFVSINPDKGLKIHNLKDLLALQGAIVPNDTPAVQITGPIDPDVAPFLREQSFDQYTRDGWRVNVTDDVPLATGEATGAGTVGSAPTSGDPADAPPREIVTIQTKVEGGNGDRLFSLGQPIKSDQAASVSAGSEPSDVSSLKPNAHLTNGTIYAVSGSVSVASLDELRGSDSRYPAWVTDRYLQLSRRLPERVRAKAHELAAGTTNPYDAAASIEAYLRTFPIDYSVPAAPRGQDNVDYFLFDAQRGYFDYHASAMAVLLRAIGIPARVATGFVIDPAQRQGDSNTFKLTQRQAFSWPEVYFAGIGWVEFNPTPSQPLINRPLHPKPAPDIAPASPAVDLGIQPPAPSSAGPAQLARGSDSNADWWLLLLLGAVCAPFALAALAAFAWEFSLHRLSRPARLWEKSLRLATWGRVPLLAHETPREFAERLGEEVPGTARVREIAQAYERSRFGQKPLSAGQARALEDAWSSARRRLLWRIVAGRRSGRHAESSFSGRRSDLSRPADL